MFKDHISTNTPEQLQQRLTRPNKPKTGANDDMDNTVENPVVEISRDIFRLESDIRKLTIRVDKRLITKNIQDSLAHFRKNFDLYFESFKTPTNPDAIFSAGTNVATYGESVGHVLNRFSSLGFENRRLAQQIIQRSRSVNNALATKKDHFTLGLDNYNEADLPRVEKASEENSSSETSSRPKAVQKPFSAYAENLTRSRATAPSKPEASEKTDGANLARALAKQSTTHSEPSVKADHALNEQLEKNRRHMQYFIANAKKAEAAYSARYKKVKQLHNEAIQKINDAQTEVEELKSRIASNSVAKSFEQCAEEERSNANFYRYSAFAYMGVFFILMGFLFVETSSAGFDWVRTTLRSLIAFSLMIPCGYVAQESRNHRQQQHSYMKTAIELKALAPFKANLPESKLAPLREEVVQTGLKSESVGKSYTDYYLMKNFDLLNELNSKLDKNETVVKQAQAS